MRLRYFFLLVASAILTVFCFFSLASPQVLASSRGYVTCGAFYGVPTTFYMNGSNTRVPIIHWKEYLGGVSPKNRCNIVTSRIQRHLENGSIRYLVPAYSDSHDDVLCASTYRYESKGYCAESNVVMVILNGDTADYIIETIIGGFLEGKIKKAWEHGAGIIERKNGDIVNYDLAAAFQRIKSYSEDDLPIDE
jgi:hypothetical protein